MDIKLLLVQVISLLYRASQSDDKSFDAREYAKHVIDQAKIPEQSLGSDFTHDSVKALKDMAMWMINVPYDYVFTMDEMKQRAKLAAGNEDSIYESIVTGITFNLTQEELITRIAQYRNNIKISLSTHGLRETMKSYYHKIMFKPETIDWKSICRDITTEMDAYDQVFRGDIDEKHPAIVDSIDFSQKEQIHDVLEVGQQEISDEGTIILSHQGVNRMLGDPTGKKGGVRRGNSVVCGALQHNFKSGFSLNVFKAHALYNKAYVTKEGAIPTLVRITFETTAKYDIMYLYRNLWENEFGTSVDMKTVSIDEATEYVYAKFAQNGWRIILTHINPSDFTYRDLIDYIDSLRAKNLEIHQVNMDYLNMITKKGLTASTAGEDIRELFRRIRNYGLEHNILMFTPHQLSMDAKKKVREGVNDFIKQIANGGYYDGCGRLDQEVDIEIYIHIVKINGISYLTIGRGKHRQPLAVTPDKDLFTCYQFSPIADIPDDINGADMSRKAPGANTQSDGGGDAWFDMAA